MEIAIFIKQRNTIIMKRIKNKFSNILDYIKKAIFVKDVI